MTAAHAHTLARAPMPPWLPGVIAAMVPHYRGAAEVAIVGRLTTDPRMRRVWADLGRLQPSRPGMTPADASRELFALAVSEAARGLPVTVNREHQQRIKARGQIEFGVAGDKPGGWTGYFQSPFSLDDGPVVEHKPDGDPVAARMQITLTTWFKRTYGSLHLGLVATVTGVALKCRVSRYAGRQRRKPAPIPAPPHADPAAESDR